MALTSFNAFLNRAMTLFTDVQPCYNQYQAATTTTLFTGQDLSIQRGAYTRAVPSPLQSGVTSYLPVLVNMDSTSIGCSLVAKQINLGTFTFGTGFSAGSSMPTQTFGNTSQATNGIVMAEVTTALGGTAGTLTITYTNQAGTAAQSTGALTITSSAVLGTCGPVVLATTDYGVRSISNCVNAGGTAPTGVITFWGLIPVCFVQNATGNMYPRNFVTEIIPPIKLAANDQLGFFNFSATGQAYSGHIYYIGDS